METLNILIKGKYCHQSAFFSPADRYQLTNAWVFAESIFVSPELLASTSTAVLSKPAISDLSAGIPEWPSQGWLSWKSLQYA